MPTTSGCSPPAWRLRPTFDRSSEVPRGCPFSFLLQPLIDPCSDLHAAARSPRSAAVTSTTEEQSNQSSLMTPDLVVDGIEFPATIKAPGSSESLKLIGYGMTDMTIETILVKFTAIGVYAGEEIKTHLKAWEGRSASDLTAEESGYFNDFVDAPVAKLVKIGVIKGIKGNQYGGTLESSIRDKLAYDDLYEDDEEAAIGSIVDFFETKNLPPGSAMYFYWPSPEELQVAVTPDKELPEKLELTVANKNVAKYLLHWYIGENPTSETTQVAVAEGIAALLGYKLDKN